MGVDFLSDGLLALLTNRESSGRGRVIDSVRECPYHPSTRTEDLVDGDLEPNLDFRGVYSTLLEDWVGLDPVPIVNGQFEQPKFIEKN